MSAWRLSPLSDALIEAKPGFACGEDPEDGVFQVRMNNVSTEGLFDFSRKRRVPRDTQNLAAYLVEPGDVLFNATNSPELVGKSAFFSGYKEPAVFSNHFLRLRPQPERLEGRFLARWLTFQFQRGIFQGMCRQWVNQATVGREALLALRIPLPDLEEQRRIAGILDHAEALRAKRRAAFVQLGTLAQALFLDLFGDPFLNQHDWPSSTLASLIRDGDTINYGVVQPGDDSPNGVPLVRVGDLLEGRVSHSTLKRIAATIEAKYKRSRLRGDEILVSCVGSIGVVVMADDSVKGFNIARAVVRVPVTDTVNRWFVAEYLRSEFVQSYFRNELRTVSQPTLNIKQLSETRVMLPPIALQCEFANRVAALERLKTIHRTAMVELDSLFTGLQHRAFRGEL